MAVEAASIIPIFVFEETKRLDLRRNQAFHNASGGDKRDRTADLLNAIQALSQIIAYIPPFDANRKRKTHATISILFKNCSMLIFSVILIS